jgi:hypothetical protein
MRPFQQFSTHLKDNFFPKLETLEKVRKALLIRNISILSISSFAVFFGIATFVPSTSIPLLAFGLLLYYAVFGRGDKRRIDVNKTFTRDFLKSVADFQGEKWTSDSMRFVPQNLVENSGLFTKPLDFYTGVWLLKEEGEKEKKFSEIRIKTRDMSYFRKDQWRRKIKHILLFSGIFTSAKVDYKGNTWLIHESKMFEQLPRLKSILPAKIESDIVPIGYLMYSDDPAEAASFFNKERRAHLENHQLPFTLSLRNGMLSILFSTNHPWIKTQLTRSLMNEKKLQSYYELLHILDSFIEGE